MNPVSTKYHQKENNWLIGIYFILFLSASKIKIFELIIKNGIVKMDYTLSTQL